MQDCTISRGSLAGSGLFIADVFKQATTFRQICPEFRKNVEGAARRFTNFVADEFPGVQRFDELRPFMVAQYQQRLRADGLSDNTVRLYLRAVKMADSFVERNYGRTTPALVVEQEIPRPAPKPAGSPVSCGQPGHNYPRHTSRRQQSRPRLRVTW